MRSVLVIILISLKVVIGFDHYWRDYNGTIPLDAVEDIDTGLILAQLTIIEGCPGLAPAGLNRSAKKANAECNGKEISTSDNIKVFCTKNPERYYWEWINVDYVNGTAKDGLVKGGYEKGTSNLYFGKVFHNGSWQIGKVVFNNDPKCHFIDKESGDYLGLKDCLVLKYNAIVNYPKM